MARVKRGVNKNKRRKYLLKQTKGYRFDRKSKERIARVAMRHAGAHAFKDRRLKKREFRQLFTLRINAASREAGISYSKLIDALKKAEIGLNRKSLAALAKDYPETFNRVISKVK
ncbi:MAG TPA: 50S ribosomal protein L20 [Candidatus Paceibacterota bacterium]|jgi:large subunit ribosomal protein L20|nr:50S ribosomal protein L20 [Candidatus Paceibacterota bacterium]